MKSQLHALGKGNRSSRLGILFGVLCKQFTTCPGGGVFDENRRALARHGWRFERDNVNRW